MNPSQRQLSRYGRRPADPPRRPVLVINPRSGDGKAARAGLAERAREAGIEAVILAPGQDLAALAGEAAAAGADALGMAGGDGSLAVVATVAATHGIPFVCVPAGTRNHFALDLGVDRHDVTGALDAFTGGVERRIDVAEVNGRMFLNNVSLGIYGDAVRSPAYRDAKVRTLLETAAEVMGPSAGELTADRVDGCRETVIGRFQQPDQADRQRAGVQRGGAIGLREGAALRVVGPLEDLIVDLRADLLPAPQRPLQLEALAQRDGAVEREPGHHLRLGVVPPRPAGLPHAVVGFLPSALQVVQEVAELPPESLGQLSHRRRHRPADADDLAVHVELELARGRVADPDRPGALVTGQPVQLVLLQPPFAGDAVHDLRLLGLPGGGPEHGVGSIMPTPADSARWKRR